MKKLFAILAIAGMAVVLSGCTSTTTYKYDKDGNLQDKIVSQNALLHNKAVDINAKAVGIEATMFDPNTGGYSPCVKILYGKAGTKTLPVVDDAGAAIDTYNETLTIDTSWWGAEISSIEYSRTAGGQLKNVTPAVDVKLKIDKGSTTTATETSSTQVKK